jgi:adenylate kinase
MARGELVSDDLVCEMVAARLMTAGLQAGLHSSMVFPGRPAQAGWLDALLDDKLFDNSWPTRAWPIVIRWTWIIINCCSGLLDAVLVPPVDGSITSTFSRPASMKLCDVDGSKLVTRNDDRLEVIQPRLAAYQEQTRPVADYYERTGRLISVNGDLPMDEVTEQMFRILEIIMRQ